MSFSSDVKAELCELGTQKTCCATAELSALLHGSATLSIGSQGPKLMIDSDNPLVADRCYTLIEQLFGISAELSSLERQNLGRKNAYRISVSGGGLPLDILVKTNLAKEGQGFLLQESVPGALLKKSCCKRAYLRGAFLANGYVGDPQRAYHMEFAITNEDYALSLQGWLTRQALAAKHVRRKEVNVIYIKESEQIVTALSMMGAHKALLNMESIRVTKQVRNNVNRIVNCENANIEKVMNASQRQIVAIELIEQSGHFKRLSPALRQVAEARLENPEMPLGELGEMLTPPVSKSAVNHRLRKIEQIAATLRPEEG